MAPSHDLDLVPPLPIQELGESGQEAKYDELHHPPQHFYVGSPHLSQSLFLHLLSKAHEHELGEQGVLEAQADPDAAGGHRLSGELAEEDAEGPCPGVGVGLVADGVEDLRRDVAPEEAPRWSVAGGEDAGVPGDGERRPACECSAGDDEGAVGCGVVGDEDEGAAADAECDVWAVRLSEAVECGANRPDGLAEQGVVADKGKAGRARRESLATRDEGEEEGEGGGEEESEVEEERP